ncbi:ABC transporter substrate-binding protein [Chloroflexia bacterium SDU3-3]|nr:ABC transporter substrate-binding protein [Chloroflexia bacterium SDU3-3]
MAMPYVPSVQFAHYYVAEKKGYFAQMGLKVTFDYHYETDIIQRIAQGTVQFGQGSGDSVLLARAQGLPIITVATVSQRFPIVLFSKASQGIKTPADLKGKTLGLSGRFGASYIGLLALLDANKLAESDLNIQEIGFNQVAAVSQDKVQVAVGYANNEPIQLQQQGIEVNVIPVSASAPLASDGLITSDTLLAKDPGLVHNFVQALLHGMQDVIDNPDEAFTISLDYVPELKSADAKTQALQRKVLAETINYWQSPATAREGLGYTDIASWQASSDFLRGRGMLTADVDLRKGFTNLYLKQ